MKKDSIHSLLSFSLFLVFFYLHPNSLSAQTPVSLDPSWDGDGKLVADGSRLGEYILVQPDGKILVGCNPFGDAAAYIRRYNDDGSQDLSFGTNGKFTVTVAERRTGLSGMKLHNGNIYICGTTTTDIGGTNTYAYAGAILGDGSNYLNSFGTAGIKKFNSGNTDFYTVTDIELDGSGNVFLTGLEWLDNLYVLKMGPTGILDPGFDFDGLTFIPTNNNDHWFEIHDLSLDKQGKILITGKKYKANNGSTIPPFMSFLVARFNANGSPDNTFALSGMGLYNSLPGNMDDAERIHVTPENNYLVAGKTWDGVDYDYSALKVTHSGLQDPTYGTNGWAVHDLLFQNKMENCLNSEALPDGRLLLTGNEGSGDTVHFALLMLNPDGSRDQIFAPNGLYRNIFNQNNNSSSKGLALDTSGKIILGGYTRTCANGTCGPLYMALSRYNNTFGTYTGVESPSVTGPFFFPNPLVSGAWLYVQEGQAGEGGEIELWDISGKQLASWPAGTLEFSLPELNSGFYLMKILVGNEMFMEKLLILAQ